jgi:hypothetical protein
MTPTTPTEAILALPDWLPYVELVIGLSLAAWLTATGLRD